MERFMIEAKKMHLFLSFAFLAVVSLAPPAVAAPSENAEMNQGEEAAPEAATDQIETLDQLVDELLTLVDGDASPYAQTFRQGAKVMSFFIEILDEVLDFAIDQGLDEFIAYLDETHGAENYDSAMQEFQELVEAAGPAENPETPEGERHDLTRMLFSLKAAVETFDMGRLSDDLQQKLERMSQTSKLLYYYMTLERASFQEAFESFEKAKK